MALFNNSNELLILSYVVEEMVEGVPVHVFGARVALSVGSFEDFNFDNFPDTPGKRFIHVESSGNVIQYLSHPLDTAQDYIVARAGDGRPLIGRVFNCSLKDGEPPFELYVRHNLAIHQYSLYFERLNSSDGNWYLQGDPVFLPELDDFMQCKDCVTVTTHVRKQMEEYLKERQSLHTSNIPLAAASDVLGCCTNLVEVLGSSCEPQTEQGFKDTVATTGSSIAPMEKRVKDAPSSGKRIQGVNWKKKAAGKVRSLLGIPTVTTDLTLVAQGVRNIYFPATDFLTLLKPRNLGEKQGLAVDNKGRTVIFVVVRLLVADSIQVVQKVGAGMSAGLTVSGPANTESSVGCNTSSKLIGIIKASANNPVILERTFVRMAWDRRGDPVWGLHAGMRETPAESDEDMFGDKIEEAGLLNI